MNSGIYIHFPFCRKKCDYCSFYSVPVDISDADIIANYSESLISEINIRRDELKEYKFDTIYFGGGTPSLMSADVIAGIINNLDKSFNLLKEDIEITLECNPDDFSISRINDYKSAGINRIVLGVQTLNQNLHKEIGRSPAICAEKMLDDFFNITNITHCLDIMFGIKGQTKEDLISEMRTIFKYRPEHISAYLLSIEKGTPLHARMTSAELDDIHLDEIQIELFNEMIDLMISNGYIHYEVSNYALPGFESRHNLKYWKFLPYAGFGPGAHSFYNDQRYFNRSSVDVYLKNKGNIREHDKRDMNATIMEYLLTGLRLIKGISINDFEMKLGIQLPDIIFTKIRELKNKKLMFIDKKGNDVLTGFTRRGLLQMDRLIFDITENLL